MFVTPYDTARYMDVLPPELLEIVVHHCILWDENKPDVDTPLKKTALSLCTHCVPNGYVRHG